MWLYLLFRAWLAKLDPFQRARAAANNLLELVLKGILDERGALRPLDDTLRGKIYGALLFAEHGVHVCAAIKAKTKRPAFEPPSSKQTLPTSYVMLKRARAAMRALRTLDPSMPATPSCVRSLRDMRSLADLSADASRSAGALARVLAMGPVHGGGGAPAPFHGRFTRAKARAPPAWPPSNSVSDPSIDFPCKGEARDTGSRAEQKGWTPAFAGDSAERRAMISSRG